MKDGSKQRKKPLDSLKVAEYFLSKIDEDAGELISNLKLQKLLYYAQGLHLAMFDEPLFKEEIEAWTHGPVVPKIYHHFKEYGDGGIPSPAKVPKLDKGTIEFLDEIYRIFGQYSAWKLRNMTHEEPPWKQAVARKNRVIDPKIMRKYFKTLLKDDA